MGAANINALQEYQQIRTVAGTAYANPHQLISMLMEGALERIALAKGAMLQDDVQEKGRLIGNTVTIVEGLRGCLDMEVGGELSTNLSDLYEYMVRQLLHANLENDPAVLDEVAGLMREIRSAWEEIPELNAETAVPEMLEDR